MAGIVELPRLVPELLRYREAKAHECEEFKDLHHDRDLCPDIERQLRAVLDSFLKYSAVAYDVQGFQDRGTDVLLKFFHEGAQESPWRYLVFQIKSYHDLQTDRYLWKNLKSQYFDAVTEYGDQLEHYFILVCTTYGKVERRKLRWIKKIFSTTANATVIDPSYVRTFLRMSQGRINIIVDSFLRDEDVVWERARRIVQSEPPTRAALVVSLCELYTRDPCEPFTVDDLTKDDFLEGMYSHLPDYHPSDYDSLAELRADHDYREEEEEEEEGADSFVPVDRARPLRERIAEDIEALFEEGITPVGESGYRIDLGRYFPIGALLLDARTRYGYERGQLSEYVFSSLQVLEQYGFDYPVAFETD